MVLKAAGGATVSVFDDLIQASALCKGQLAAFINASSKTIDNYRIKNKRLGPVASEQHFQLLGLYKKGREIFGSAEAFNQWLNHPVSRQVARLGEINAFDLLYTAGGVNLVMEEFLRIEYGALA